MSKKLSAVGLVGLALCLCCAFSAVPKMTKAQDGPQKMTLQQRYVTEPPLTILNARRTDKELTVEVQNRGLAPVEYFELEVDINIRLKAGRNTLRVSLRGDPENFERVALSLAPQEIRTFQFPIQGGGIFLKIETVLLSNGQGWTHDFYLKRLDKANEHGVLWVFDPDENERRGMRVVRPNVSK